MAIWVIEILADPITTAFAGRLVRRSVCRDAGNGLVREERAITDHGSVHGLHAEIFRDDYFGARASSRDQGNNSDDAGEEFSALLHGSRLADFPAVSPTTGRYAPC
ncbi:unannotated protein [freshwater metagenome]|uniref:Unannotated protein n=1 Tax=freshwater metagenome TaxID=449393 RepID=A0A6J7VLS3_9ZZZZ